MTCFLFFHSVCWQKQFQDTVVNRRQAEYDRLRAEREERYNQILTRRKQEREYQKKMIFYVRMEEERLRRLHEEEEARRREGTSLL